MASGIQLSRANFLLCPMIASSGKQVVVDLRKPLQIRQRGYNNYDFINHYQATGAYEITTHSARSVQARAISSFPSWAGKAKRHLSN